MTANMNNLNDLRYRVIASILGLMLIMSCMIMPAHASGQRFTDVGSNHWAYNWIEQAAEKGYVSGTGDGAFAPDNTVTNAQWMTMITQAFYKKTVTTSAAYFEGSEWWMPYAEMAYIKGIMKGTTVLAPRDSETAQWDATIDAGINRYDMAQVLYNVMTTETTMTPDSTAIEAAKQQIADWGSIPANYQQAVAACYAAGLLSGVDSSGTFGGTSVMTRAQAATVLCKIAG